MAYTRDDTILRIEHRVSLRGESGESDDSGISHVAKRKQGQLPAMGVTENISKDTSPALEDSYSHGLVQEQWDKYRSAAETTGGCFSISGTFSGMDAEGCLAMNITSRYQHNGRIGRISAAREEVVRVPFPICGPSQVLSQLRSI